MERPIREHGFRISIELCQYICNRLEKMKKGTDRLLETHGCQFEAASPVKCPGFQRFALRKTVTRTRS